ncbi:hypothetical protein [Bernardetia sp.]|nr:hypothetical protein [Bernardetia sp.]
MKKENMQSLYYSVTGVIIYSDLYQVSILIKKTTELWIQWFRQNNLDKKC